MLLCSRWKNSSCQSLKSFQFFHVFFSPPAQVETCDNDQIATYDSTDRPSLGRTEKTTSATKAVATEACRSDFTHSEKHRNINTCVVQILAADSGNNKTLPQVTIAFQRTKTFFAPHDARIFGYSIFKQMYAKIDLAIFGALIIVQNSSSCVAEVTSCPQWSETAGCWHWLRNSWDCSSEATSESASTKYEK